MDYYYNPTPSNNDELMHYGVIGMRWGIRRGTKKLAKATTKEEREKAVAILNKHRNKATKKINDLKKEAVSLEKTRDRVIVKNDVAAADLKRRASATRKKAYRRFTSRESAQDLLYKADKLDAKANNLIARSEEAKAKVVANATLQKTFKHGIDDIDEALVKKGRRYING